MPRLLNTALERTAEVVVSSDHNASQSSLRNLRGAVTLIALGAALIHILCPDLAIDYVTVLLLVLALVPWLGPLVSSIEVPGVGKVELRGEVQRAVEAASTGALERIGRLDTQLVDYWERGINVSSEQSADHLSQIQAAVRELEAAFERSRGGERLAVGLALRDAYWKLLAQARQHYASSEPYQTIRSSVMKGFSNLGR